MTDYKKYIRNVPDFPKAGINFKDITTLVKRPAEFKQCIDELLQKFSGQKFDYVVGIESRGFIFGSALAYRMGIGFVPVRKPGKLPATTMAASYDLEYGRNELHIHIDAIEKGSRVLIVDDLLATGGTIAATCELIEKSGGHVGGIGVIVELTFLQGRQRLAPHPVISLVQYDKE